MGKGKKQKPIQWRFRLIRSRVRRTVFTRGFKPYVKMILVFFLFSFAGIVNSAASGEVRYIDERFGTGIVNMDDVNNVVNYAMGIKVVRALPEVVRDGIIKPWVNSTALSYSWLLNILATNQSYVERNMGEVVAFLILTVLFFAVVGFLVSQALAIGQYRFMMENRFQRNVKKRRILAPFGDGRLLHVIKTVFFYRISLLLWMLTVVGGIYKAYQYYFVPYIIAENPDVTWKEAKKLSIDMTRGYKWNIFVMNISYIYLYVINMIPFLNLLVSTPVSTFSDIEMYFVLRHRRDIDRSLFVESGFDSYAYIDRVDAGEEPDEISREYELKDVVIKGSSFDSADKYHITDFIIMFFVFCMIGWIWEVGLHLAQTHEFANRGALYGPWLPIYGSGGATIIMFLNRYKNNKPKLFVYTMLLCGILEYLTSFVLDFAKNAEYWNYNDIAFNLNGRICLAGLLAFAVGGFAGVYVLGPIIKRALEKFGKRNTKILCAVLIIAFAVDLLCCAIFGFNTGEGVGNALAMAGLNI